MAAVVEEVSVLVAAEVLEQAEVVVVVLLLEAELVSAVAVLSLEAESQEVAAEEVVDLSLAAVLLAEV